MYTCLLQQHWQLSAVTHLFRQRPAVRVTSSPDGHAPGVSRNTAHNQPAHPSKNLSPAASGTGQLARQKEKPPLLTLLPSTRPGYSADSFFADPRIFDSLHHSHFQRFLHSAKRLTSQENNPCQGKKAPPHQEELVTSASWRVFLKGPFLLRQQDRPSTRCTTALACFYQQWNSGYKLKAFTVVLLLRDKFQRKCSSSVHKAMLQVKRDSKAHFFFSCLDTKCCFKHDCISEDQTQLCASVKQP